MRLNYYEMTYAGNSAIMMLGRHKTKEIDIHVQKCRQNISINIKTYKHENLRSTFNNTKSYIRNGIWDIFKTKRLSYQPRKLQSMALM